MKTTILHGRITARDLSSIIGNLSVGDDLFVTNWQTAINALECLKDLPAWSFNVTNRPGEYVLLERAV